MDTTTIEDASRATGISLGTLGYWIVAGMLDATVTAQGRIVRLSDVRRVAAQLGAPGAPRELLIHQDRAAGPRAPLLAAPRDELLHELHERLERLDTQLQRVDQALTGQVGQLDRVETARARDAVELQRVQQTLAEHGEALRRLESAQSRAAAAEPAASPRIAIPSAPPLVLRFRPIGTAEAAAPEAAAPATALRLTRAADAATTAAPPVAPAPKSGFPFGLRAAFPRVPFMGRKAIRDNT